MSSVVFYKSLLAFNIAVALTSLALNFVWIIDQSVYCMTIVNDDGNREPNDSVCTAASGTFRCNSLLGICDEEAWLPYRGVSLLTISLCSLAFICAISVYGFVFRKNLPTDNNSKFLICMVVALLTCFTVGPAGTRYVLLTEFHTSQQSN